MATTASTPLPPRLLSICLGREPKSLFLYQANPVSARSVLTAIYDGPVDGLNYQSAAGHFGSTPFLATGDITFELVQVNPGDWMADADGYLTNLAQEMPVRPRAVRIAVAPRFIRADNLWKWSRWLFVRGCCLAGSGRWRRHSQPTIRCIRTRWRRPCSLRPSICPVDRTVALPGAG